MLTTLAAWRLQRPARICFCSQFSLRKQFHVEAPHAVRTQAASMITTLASSSGAIGITVGGEEIPAVISVPVVTQQVAASALAPAPTPGLGSAAPVEESSGPGAAAIVAMVACVLLLAAGVAYFFLKSSNGAKAVGDGGPVKVVDDALGPISGEQDGLLNVVVEDQAGWGAEIPEKKRAITPVRGPVRTAVSPGRVQTPMASQQVQPTRDGSASRVSSAAIFSAVALPPWELPLKAR